MSNRYMKYKEVKYINVNIDNLNKEFIEEFNEEFEYIKAKCNTACCNVQLYINDVTEEDCIILNNELGEINLAEIGIKKLKIKLDQYYSGCGETVHLVLMR